MTAVRPTMLCVALCASASLLSDIIAQEKPKAAEATRADGHRQKMLGAWGFAGALDSTNDPQPGARMKFWGLKHWVITESDQNGKLVFHHGGTYTLDGDDYVETIEFAGDQTSALIGRTFKFKIKVDGDTYLQTGVGNSFNERWVRQKND